MSNKVNVLVVTDTDDFFSKQTTSSLLQHVGANYAVQTISPKQFSDEPWEDNTTLIVFPGSQSQVPSLSDKAAKKVKQFAQNGGNVLGLGAGATQLMSSQHLPLGTYQALQISEPVQSLSLPSTKQTVTSYLDSNNAFSFQNTNKDALIIAETMDKQSVITAHKIDKGTVILAGSQIECNAEDITSVDTKYKASLVASNKDRDALFRSLLEKLGLKTIESKQFAVPSLSPIYLVNNNSIVLHQLKETISKENKDMKFTYGTPNLQFYNEVDKISEEPKEGLLPIVISTSLDTNNCTFNSAIYSKLLTTSTYGKTLLYAETTTSTQAILTENFMLFRKFVDGLVFTANRQVKGVGRGNNIWVSPEGCLMFSIQISHKDPSTLLFLQYLMGIAIVDSIRSKQGYDDLDIRIKWPNDIYYKKNKIAGVLVSSNYFDGKFSVVIGVGLNLSNDKPTSCVNSVIMEYNKEHNANLRVLSKEEMLSSVINKFEKMYKVFEKQGFKLFESLYYKYWLHSDQIVNLETEDEGIVKVIIRGLKPSGFLEATSADYNKTYELYPDGNSFDMFHGLIKKKN